MSKPAIGSEFRADTFYPSDLTNFKGTIYFTAGDSINGKELWKINSTGDAVLVKDINPGANSSSISNLTNVGSILYFIADNGTRGRELWKLDDIGNPVLVKDINSGDNSSDPYDLTNVGGILYFTADNGTTGRELWKIDDIGNPVLVKDINSGTDLSNTSNLTNLDGTLYFTTGGNLTTGGEFTSQKLWKADNTGKAFLVKDFNSGTRTYLASDFIRVNETYLNSVFTSVNGIHYFVTGTYAIDYSTQKQELWKIDSMENAVLVPTNAGTQSNRLSDLTNVNGILYFTNSDFINPNNIYSSTTKEGLWKIDSMGDPVLVPTKAGAEWNDLSNLTNVNGTLYFIATDFTTINDSTSATKGELWKIDSMGNAVVVTTNAGAEYSFLSNLTNINGTLYFKANSATGEELWKIDSMGAAVLVKDFNRVGGVPSSSNLTNINGTLYFTVSDATTGKELWKIDSMGNAVLVKDINPGSKSSYPSGLTNIDGTLYFTAYNDTIGRELWRIDSMGDAVLIKDINPVTSDRDPLDPSWAYGSSGNDPSGKTNPVEKSPLTSSDLVGVNIFDRNLLATTSTIKGVGIQAISQKQTNKVNEIGFFNVDDLNGKIDGIVPGEAGYIKAAIDRAKSILTTLGGDFFNTEKQEIGLDPNKIYQFFEIKNGSLTEVKQKLDRGETPTNIRLSIADSNGNSPIKVTGANIQAGYNISINNDELVLKVTKLDGAVPNRPIGSEAQGKTEGRIIDLTNYQDRSLTVDITTKSDAVYQSQIGFYVVKDALGTIELADGITVKPGDANYAMVAVKNAIANAGLQANRLDSKTNQPIAGGQIYAPVVVAQGTMNDFVKNPSSNIQAYFNYIGANTDKVDHFRQIGANTFGVEDMYGGGDRDFNDIVIQMKIKTT